MRRTLSRGFARGYRHVRKNFPWIVALLATGYLRYYDGWNHALARGFEAGLAAACPRVEERDPLFVMRDADARAALAPDSPLRKDLAEYDRLKAAARACGFLSGAPPQANAGHLE